MDAQIPNPPQLPVWSADGVEPVSTFAIYPHAQSTGIYPAGCVFGFPGGVEGELGHSGLAEEGVEVGEEGFDEVGTA